MKRFSILMWLTACCAIVPLDPASAETIPLPRPRPPPAVGDEMTPSPEPGPSACRLRLTAELASAPSVSELAQAEECPVDDMVRLEAVVLPDKTRVALIPPAIVRCTFAESVVHWVRGIAPAVRAHGMTLRGIDNYASYDCRGRNRLAGAKLSEHGKGNALDVRSIRPASGKPLDLADPHAPKDLREALRRSACTHFTTVLGPGSDGYHEHHIHLDLIERRRGLRICQWEVREPEQETSGVDQIPLPRPRPASAK